MITEDEKNTASRSGLTASDLALIAVFAALIAVFALIPAVFTVGAVPFAFHMIIIVLAPLVLGAWRSVCSVLLYLLVGVAGLPVFSGGRSGPSIFVSASGGYVIGWVVAVLVAGALRTALLRRRPRKGLLAVWLTVAGVVCVIITHLFGVAWFMVAPNLHMGLGAALLATAPFFPLDLLKVVIAALLAVAVLSAFPRLMPARKA